MTFVNRLPEIILQVEERSTVVAEKAAARVEFLAKENVRKRSGDLERAIHVEPNEDVPGSFEVKAGNNRAFYGHMIEHGTSHSPAFPFLVPAVEAVRMEVNELGRQEFLNL